MWTRVRLRVGDPGLVEAIVAELWDLGAAGCEVRDGETFSDFGDSAFGAASADRTEVIAFFDGDAAPPDFAGLEQGYPGVRLLGVSPYDDIRWREGWKQFFRPTRISPRITVRPSWHPDPEPEGSDSAVLVIDPMMAFGTGTHATTRLCIRAIDEHLSRHPGCSFLDVGCGSGILTLAAARLGAGEMLGVDIDPQAVEIARQNWADNGLGRADEAPFRTMPLAGAPSGFRLVAANLLSHILVELRDELVRVTARGGSLLMSGILASQRDDLLREFGVAELALVSEDRLEDWVLLRFSRS